MDKVLAAGGNEGEESEGNVEILVTLCEQWGGTMAKVGTDVARPRSVVGAPSGMM